MSSLSARPSSTRSFPRAWTLMLCCFLGGGFFVPLLLLATTSKPQSHNLYTYLLLLIIVYSAFKLSRLIALGELNIIRAIFWLFNYVALGIAPLCQIHTGLFPNLATSSTLAGAAVIVLVGNLAFDAGGIFASNSRRDAVRRASQPRDIAVGRAKSLGIIGLIGSAYYIVKAGSLTSFFLSREDLRTAISGGVPSASDNSQVSTAFLYTAGTVPILIAAVAWTVILGKDSRRRSSTGARLWWVALFAVNVIVNNPISSSRYWALTVIAAFVFSLGRLGPRSFRTTLIIGAVAAIVIFPYSDYYRLDAQSRAAANLQTRSIPTELSVKDYDQMTMIANGEWWVRSHGYTYGSQLLSDALFFIPHTVWPGRATDTGTIIGVDLPFAAQNVNLSSPLWLEFWIDFSWPGLLIGMFIVGWFAAKADDLFKRMHRDQIAARRPKVLVVALAAIAGYEFILLRGPVLQAMSHLFVIIVCLWFIRDRRAKTLRASSGSVQTPIGNPPCESNVGRIGADNASIGWAPMRQHVKQIRVATAPSPAELSATSRSRRLGPRRSHSSEDSFSEGA